MKQSKLVAGHRGVGKVVDGIAMMESADSVQWLVPNNFVISTAAPLKDDPEMGDKIIRTLAKKRVSGIAIKLNRYLKEIPESMLKAANEFDIPIVILPYRITSTQIINAVTFEIFRREMNSPGVCRENTFLKEVLFETLDPHSINSHVMNLGWSVNHPMAVVIIKDDALEYTPKLERLFSQCHFAYSFATKRHIVAITELKPAEAKDVLHLIYHRDPNKRNILIERASKLSEALKEAYPEHEPIIGVGFPSLSVLDLSNSFYQAKVSLCMNLSCRIHKPIAYFGEIGVFSILLSRHNEYDTSQLIERTIGVIKRYDAKKNSELLKTMEYYYVNGMNIDRTAAELHVHSNTVRHRIAKINDMFENDMFYRTNKMDMQIMIKLARCREMYDAEFETKVRR